MLKKRENILKRYDLALIGKEIAHSKSEEMYKSFLKGSLRSYTLIDCDSEKEIPSLGELFERYDGVSITSPYKKHFLEKVVMEEQISKLDAINCLKKDGETFIGTNTDFLALKDILPKYIAKYEIEKIFILGRGSMGVITESVLEKISGPNFEFITRSSYEGAMDEIDFSKLEQKTMVINACARSFEFKGQVSKDLFFYDYNYSFGPHRDKLSHKCDYVDGLDLLNLQAKHALEFWNNSLT